MCDLKKIFPTEDGKPIIYNKKFIVCAVIALVILLGIIVILILWLTGPGYDFKGELIIIPRSEWRALSQRRGVDVLQLPVHNVIISHTVSTSCTTKATCDEHVRHFQYFHLYVKKWSDIGYNFLIGGDGLVYEGRGWRFEGAHTKGHNKDSLGIAFIGTFTDIEPTRNELVAFHLLIEEAIQRKVLVSDYKLYGARQFDPKTESPGTALYNVISKWSHWSQNV